VDRPNLVGPDVSTIPLPTLGLTELTFSVVGQPRQQGDKAAAVTKTGRAFVYEQSDRKRKDWRSDVIRAAREALAGREGFGNHPVEVWATWVFPRPQRLKPTDPLVMAMQPDGDKLERAVWDGLTQSTAIGDDARIARWHGQKRYSSGSSNDPPGVHVRIVPIVA
jgi:Holliday junction resolvase RusA-like endonuclease